MGNLSTAEHYPGMLLDHSTRHTLRLWLAYGTCHQGVLAIKRGDVMTGSRLLRAGFVEFSDPRTILREVAMLRTEALGDAGSGRAPMMPHQAHQGNARDSSGPHPFLS